MSLPTLDTTPVTYPRHTPRREWSHELELRGCEVAPWQTLTGDLGITEGGHVHAVVAVRDWENRQHAFFVDWITRCGMERTQTGSTILGTAGLEPVWGPHGLRSPRRMMCPDCWSASFRARS